VKLFQSYQRNLWNFHIILVISPDLFVMQLNWFQSLSSDCYCGKCRMYIGVLLCIQCTYLPHTS
jgi:hypothetical protein